VVSSLRKLTWSQSPFEKYKWILECCLKIENVIIWNTSTNMGTSYNVENVKKGQSGRTYSSTDDESIMTVLLAFTLYTKEVGKAMFL
jgi:hypothetical protein